MISTELKTMLSQLNNDEISEVFVLLKQLSKNHKFLVGDELYYMSSRKNERVEGVVTKVNSVNISLQCEGFTARVHPSFLKYVEKEPAFNPLTGDFE